MEDIRNDLKPGMIVKVHSLINDVNSKGEEKQRVQIFEGIILATKHGNGPSATFTVRKVSKGFGVERIFPTHSPLVQKVELVREMKVKQSRAYYLRTHGKKLKEIRKPRKAAEQKESAK